MESTHKIALLGRGPISHAGLYHYGPYKTVARIVPQPRTRLPIEEKLYGLEGHWPLDLQPPEAVTSAMIPCKRLTGIMENWRVDIAMLDGIEPYNPQLLECLNGWRLVVRTQGLTSIPTEKFEAVVFDIFPRHTKPQARIDILDRLNEISHKQIHLELVFHTDILDAAQLTPFLDQVQDNTPLHIEYMGKASRTRAENLVERLRKRGFPYIYVRDHENWIIDDTKCPRCGVTVIARYQGFTRNIEVDEETRCKHCGTKILLREAGKPGRLWRTMYMQGLGVVWMPGFMLVKA